MIVTPGDVERMLEATEDWQELLCLSVLAYIGLRRDSASRLRWRDVDLDAGNASASAEKGSKVVCQADASTSCTRSCAPRIESGHVGCGADDYVIPNRRAGDCSACGALQQDHLGDRPRVAERVGVRATVHALRRAFAVAFLTSHPGAIESLQALMNHARIDTTQVYLRALNKSKAMEAVRDLSWGPGFRSSSKGAYGIRTRAAAVRGRCPRPLDECAGGTDCSEASLPGSRPGGGGPTPIRTSVAAIPAPGPRRPSPAGPQARPGGRRYSSS